MSNNNDDTNTTTTDDTTTNIDDSTTTVDEDNAGNDSPKSERGTSANKNNKFMNLLNLLEAAVNPSVCLQQYICSLSKSSANNVAAGGTSTDKIISGIFGYGLNGVVRNVIAKVASVKLSALVGY